MFWSNLSSNDFSIGPLIHNEVKRLWISAPWPGFCDCFVLITIFTESFKMSKLIYQPQNMHVIENWFWMDDSEHDLFNLNVSACPRPLSWPFNVVVLQTGNWIKLRRGEICVEKFCLFPTMWQFHCYWE